MTTEVMTDRERSLTAMLIAICLRADGGIIRVPVPALWEVEDVVLHVEVDGVSGDASLWVTTSGERSQ